MAEFGDMKGWKLGQKKTIKAKLSDYQASVTKVQAKLGAGWSINIDFPAFAEHTKDKSSSYLADPGKYIVVAIIGKMVECDIEKMDQMTIDTINKLVGENKVITYTCGAKGDTYPISYRLDMKCDESSGLWLKWSGDYYSYEHNSQYITEYVDNLPGVAANPPYPGNWTLVQLKSLKEGQSKLDAAEAKLKEKLGATWAFDIDWESIATNIADKSSSYVQKPGKYVMEAIFQKFVECDLNKFDDDVTEAMNELCGASKVIHIAFGPKSDTYEISYRLSIAVDEDSGCTVKWSGDYYSYEWNSDYLNQFVLANA